MLTSKQRSYLSRLAVNINPMVMVGKEGVREGVERALSAEFAHRELVKLRFVEADDGRAEAARLLAEKTRAELVRVIGKVAVFYRRSADPAKREIELPS
jgi:RNA-binding protein